MRQHVHFFSHGIRQGAAAKDGSRLRVSTIPKAKEDRSAYHPFNLFVSAKALSERPVSPSFSAGPGARNLGILYGEKEHPHKTDRQHLSRKEVYMRTCQRSLSVKHWDLRNPSQKGVRTVCSALAEVTSRCSHIHGSFSYRDIQTNKYSICVSVMFTSHTVCVEFQ